MIGGGLSSLDVIVNLVLAEAEPASLTAEHTTTIPESLTVVLTIVNVDLASGVVIALYRSLDEPKNINDRSPSIDQKTKGDGLPCPKQ